MTAPAYRLVSEAGQRADDGQVLVVAYGPNVNPPLRLPTHSSRVEVRLEELFADPQFERAAVFTPADGNSEAVAIYERVPAPTADPIPLLVGRVRVSTDPEHLGHLRAAVSSTERAKIATLAQDALASRLGAMAGSLRRSFPELIFETEVEGL
jgi:hypothetical protein